MLVFPLQNVYFRALYWGLRYLISPLRTISRNESGKLAIPMQNTYFGALYWGAALPHFALRTISSAAFVKVCRQQPRPLLVPALVHVLVLS